MAFLLKTSKRDSGISVASTGADSACLRCLAGSGLRVSVTREVLYSPGLDPDMKMVETVVEGSLGVGEGSSSATSGAATGFPPTCCSFFSRTWQATVSRFVNGPQCNNKFGQFAPCV